MVTPVAGDAITISSLMNGWGEMRLGCGLERSSDRESRLGLPWSGPITHLPYFQFNQAVDSSGR
jgi:hypothetical protein